MAKKIKQHSSQMVGVSDSPIKKIVGYGGLVVVILTILVPIWVILVTSFKERSQIYTKPLEWLADPMVWENYSRVITEMDFGLYIRNSLFITTVLVVGKVTIGVVSAFALALMRFPGRNLVFIIVVSSLMVPGEVTVIPNFQLVSELGWRNSFVGIIIPTLGTAFGTFLMRNHFMSLPSEIIEAARMDGASFWRMLWRVVMPMSWPTLVAFTLITTVNEWNSYLWPLLMADNEQVAPLPVGLTFLIQVDGSTNWGSVMAGTILTALPVLIVFILLQRQMIKGLTAGAIKG